MKVLLLFLSIIVVVYPGDFPEYFKGDKSKILSDYRKCTSQHSKSCLYLFGIRAKQLCTNGFQSKGVNTLIMIQKCMRKEFNVVEIKAPKLKPDKFIDIRKCLSRNIIMTGDSTFHVLLKFYPNLQIC